MRKTQQVPTQPIPVGMPYYPGAMQSPSYQPRTAVNNQSQYTMMRTLQTSTDEILEQQNNIYKQLKSNALDKMAKQEYQPAVFAKAVVYRNERSYMRKIDNYFQELDLFCNTDEYRYFGLGPYFYVEFFRRLVWLFLVLTLVNGFSIYINYNGQGLNNYSLSFSSYLIKTTLGNYSGQTVTNYDFWVISLAPAVSYLALFIFYLIWKVHVLRAIRTQDEDNKDVKPQKFCIEIEGLPESYINEDELIKFFSSFGPVYEVSLARRYENKLSYFQEIDELQQQIKEEQLEFMLSGDDSNRKAAAQKKAELQKLQQNLRAINIHPYTVSCFVHFQYQKSKAECLAYFNDQYLFSNCGHGIMRNCCCCCVKDPDQRVTFQGNPLKIVSQNPPPPEDINWKSFEISFCNRFLRGIFAFIIILIFLAITCTIIGLCSIYITTHSNNCDGIDTSIYTPTTVTATGSSVILRCYCNANLVQSFTDSGIKNVCGSYLTDIYIQQSIQYAVLVTSVITNFLFAWISDRLVSFVRPTSRSASLKIKAVIITVFLTLNTIVIPILIYADIFGFQPSSYVSFLTIISSDVKNFLAVTNLSFYPNFTNVWYRNVSPLFTNYIIFNVVGIWVNFIIFKCCCGGSGSLQDKQNRILQKTMNRKITDFRLDVEKEAANLYLIVIMASLFWAGIPALVPLAFINILSRYIINRNLLQNHSTRVAGLGESFSGFTLILLPAILILFPMIDEWMLIANSYIYPYGSFSFKLTFLTGYISELDLQLYLPFYIAISALALLEVLIYNTIIRFCSCLCSCCYEKKQLQYHARPFSEYTKTLNVQCSYHIRNNDKMRNVIINLEKYLTLNEMK